MGTNVADTKVAMPGSPSKFVLLFSALGAGAGIGEVSRDGGSVRAMLISGAGASGGDVLFTVSMETVVVLIGGRVALTGLSCGVKGTSGRGIGSVLTELRGGVLLLVCVDVGLVVVGVVVLKLLVFRVETLPGAGGDAVLRALIREVGILPPAAGGGEEAALELCWEGADFLPENGAGAVLTELGLEVVVVFLEGETLDFGVGVFLFKGDCGGFSFSLFSL